LTKGKGRKGSRGANTAFFFLTGSYSAFLWRFSDPAMACFSSRREENFENLPAADRIVRFLIS